MFRPCIDLHEGKVKQIVGGSLTSDGTALRTNFVSDRPAAWFAELYKRDQLSGGHIIMLGPGNEAPAREALAVYPGGLQIGGGITIESAAGYLEAGASHVILTSWIFQEGKIHWDRLAALRKAIGRERLVIDLSCRKRGGKYFVALNRWQTVTDLLLEPQLFESLKMSGAEFLVHAVDREGLGQGIDGELVEKLGRESPLPVTYAGGANSLNDLETAKRLGAGKVDVTIGSALDIFGGNGVRYADAVAFNRRELQGKA